MLVRIVIDCRSPDRGHGRVIHIDRQNLETECRAFTGDHVFADVEEGENVEITMFTRDAAHQYDAGTKIYLEAMRSHTGKVEGTNGIYQWVVNPLPGVSKAVERKDPPHRREWGQAPDINPSGWVMPRKSIPAKEVAEKYGVSPELLQSGPEVKTVPPPTVKDPKQLMAATDELDDSLFTVDLS